MNDPSSIFVYRIGSPTSHLGRPPRFYPSDLLRQEGCQFASVYAVRREDAEAISSTAGTAQGFKGIVWSQRLWVDFDNEEGAEAARQLLKEQGYDYVEYNTGNRGAHFGIVRDSNPSHLLPAQDRAWVVANMSGADLSLYWHLHLIRLPGAVHEVTGRRKTLVARQSGKTLILPKYVLAESSSSRTYPEGSKRSSIFSRWQVVSKLTGSPVNGSRHKHLVELALALKRDTGLSFDETLWVVEECNRGWEDPKGKEEVEKIVRWVYGKE